ncbi:MAG: TraR/DksA family transcriptional regulator [Lewinellaceae bacterium]|nr:TraR/DksA family transcriptional regulator [Lewinellaceae bacterium]
MSNEPKTRYNDEDLQEFKVLIEERLAKATEELNFTEHQIAELNENGFNQQGGDWNDDASIHSDLEFLQRMASRQQRHVQDLRNALLRIQHKTYGVCIITGQLIDKNRLRLVPHATKSIDGKNIANANKPASMESSGDAFPELEDADRPAGKPVSEKVRIGKGPRTPKVAEDWEPEAEAPDEAGYETQKFDDEDE